MVRLAHSSLPTPTPTSLSGLLRTRGILIKSSLSSRMPRTPAGSTLSSGSRDSMIHNHDVRSAQDVESTLRGHRQEVCGLKWSPDGKQLASGGNDNLLNIWDVGRSTPRFVFSQHTAAVKALAWCPFRSSLLASGGGTADRTIRFWNTSSGTLRNTVDTKSQVRAPVVAVTGTLRAAVLLCFVALLRCCLLCRARAAVVVVEPNPIPAVCVLRCAL